MVVGRHVAKRQYGREAVGLEAVMQMIVEKYSNA